MPPDIPAVPLGVPLHIRHIRPGMREDVTTTVYC
jgi:hypothetical protein